MRQAILQRQQEQGMGANGEKIAVTLGDGT